MMVKGRMEKINDESVEIPTPIDPPSETEARSVDVLFLKPQDFDLLDRATQESITELQA